VGQGREERLALVRHFFNTVLDRIYGSQESALAKIVAPSSDRTCRLLYDDQKPVGVLVVKKILTNEHYPNSLEIKTLALLDKNASGKGYGSALLQKVEQIASELQANSIHVTVNSSVPESINFFQKKGFFMACPLKGIGKEGTQEFLLVKKLSQQAEKTAQVAKQALSTKGTKRKSPEKAPEPRSFTSAENQSTSFPPSRTYYTAKRLETTRPLEVTLKKLYVKAIQDGSKTVEGRINSGMFRNLKVGQTIRFFSSYLPEDQVTCKITGLNSYPSFEKMLRTEGHQSCLPESSSIEAAVRTYHNIPSFTERAARSGVLAIQIQKIA
jgi:ASC-1-like (ASCH) protein/GNAT superfamily N-acetyltransferase